MAIAHVRNPRGEPCISDPVSGREVVAAVATPVRLRLPGVPFLDVHRPAARAGDAVRPAAGDPPPFGRLLVGEHIEQLHQGESATVVSARCVRHVIPYLW